MAAVGQRGPVGPLGRVVAPVCVLAAALLVWQLLVTSRVWPTTILPAPLAVARRLGHDLAAGSLIARTGVTLGEALLGCALAIVVALPLGYMLARWPLAEAAVSPLIAASQAIPAVAIAPLLVVWIGYGVAPVVSLCALMVFFPMALATVLGLRQIDHALLWAAALDGAHGWSLLWHVQWPLARKPIMMGLRTGFTLSITGAVVGEFMMGGRGLGMVVSVQSSSADTTGLFATIAILCLLAVAIYLIIWAVEVLTDPLRPIEMKEISA
jgi:NitT/TauT family transport system permease protein